MVPIVPECFLFVNETGLSWLVVGNNLQYEIES